MATTLKSLLGDAYHEGMTTEEIDAVLDDAIKGVTASAEDKGKALLSKRNSEIADLKKKLTEKMTDEERRVAEEAAAKKALEDENASLKRQIAKSNHVSSFLSGGYTAEQAEAAAEAVLNGDTAGLMNIQLEVMKAQKAAIEASVMKDTPRPEVGAAEKKYSSADRAKLSDKEFVALFENNRDALFGDSN